MTEDAWTFLFFILWIVITLLGVFAKDGVFLIFAGLVAIVYAYVVFKDAIVPSAFAAYFPFMLSMFGVIEILGGAFLIKESVT